MALNYQEIFTQIRSIGQSAHAREKTLGERRELARKLLERYKEDISGLRRKLDEVRQVDPAVRCALPVSEMLDAHLAPPPLPTKATLIAADGSQVIPDRHAAIQFGVVNVGAIVMQINSGRSPVVTTDSQMLFDDELFVNGSPITDEMLALKRDLDERKKLLDLAVIYDTPGEPVITFTDGPIELWGAKGNEEDRDYHESLKTYLSVLSQLQSRGVITAGYVDKPGADLVTRLLELMVFDPSQGKDFRAEHPLRGVGDRWLFGEKGNPLLKPGERSGVFAIQSKSEKYYQGVLALHFFYVNMGTEREPWVVRVEIPKWVADDPDKLGMLHAVLVAQCRQMGVKPYPYLLHRAHETARVSNNEKMQVEQMLQLELRRQGGEIGEGSNKQFHKDQPGRTAYK